MNDLIRGLLIIRGPVNRFFDDADVSFSGKELFRVLALCPDEY